MSVRLRPARSGDAEPIAAIYAPIVRDAPISVEVRRVGFEGGAWPVAAALAAGASRVRRDR